MWTIELLGGLSASSSQRRTSRFRTQKAAALLAYLAFHPSPQSRELLIEAFWPDAEIEVGRHNLSNALSFLRHLLEPPGVPPGTVVMADRFMVRLNPAAITTDVAAFENAVTKAQQERLAPSQRIAHVEQAIDLYKGPLLPGFYDEWIGPEALRLESLFVRTLLQAVHELLDKGNPEKALSFAQSGVAADPLSEDAVFALMRSLAGLGHPDLALKAFRGFADRMYKEMDAQPSDALKNLARDLGKSRSAPITSNRTEPRDRGSDEMLPANAQVEEPLGTSPETESHSAQHQRRLVGGEFLLRTTNQFFDREDEAVRLGKMLSTARTRLVTLTGPGGTGKTRLALEVAAKLVNDPISPVTNATFVSLAEVSDTSMLFDVVGRSIGLLPTPNRQPIDQVADTLATMPGTLLILDNFEQLGEDGALAVRSLLGKADEVKLFVTSRQNLRIEGERVFHLAPLPTSRGAQSPEELMCVPSVALYVDRAQSALPDFQVTQRNAAAVSQLCDWLEGVPLAIELAAARASVLTPTRILEMVQANRLDFLATHRRDRASRHRTLRETLNWSYKLLPEDDQIALAQLSVFRGGWTLEAAQAVFALSEGQTQDLLTLLRDSSMIDVIDDEDGLRFAMLETIREYAAQQLDLSGQKEAVRRRHAAYYVGLKEVMVRGVPGPRGVDTIRQIGREQANYREALLWAQSNSDDPLNTRLGLALIRAWNALSWQQVAQWLATMHEDKTPAAQVKYTDAMMEPMASLLLPLSGTLHPTFEPFQAMVDIEQVADLFGEQDMVAHRAWTLIYLGYLALDRVLGRARAALEEALILMRALGSAVGTATALTVLSQAISFQGEFERAQELGAQAIELLVDRGDTMSLGRCLLTQGRIALARGDHVRAEEFFARNLALRQRIQDRPGVGVATACLGLLALDRDDFIDAAHYLNEALAIFNDTSWGDSLMADYALCYLGRANMGQRRFAEASELARESLSRLGKRKSRYGCCICLNLVAELEAGRAHYVRAARLAGASDTMHETLGLARTSKERELLRRLRLVLGARLGEAELAHELEIGKKLSEEDAISLGLRDV